MEILKELQPIFQDVFDDETLVITEKTTAADIEDWDSLAQIRLIVAIEKQFGIKFAFEELQSAINVGDMVKLIEAKRSK